MVAGVAPENTVVFELALPVAALGTSIAPAPDAGDRPEYSSPAIPMSAVHVVVTVMVGLVPPPAVIGAVQILSSVASAAVKCSTSV